MARDQLFPTDPVEPVDGPNDQVVAVDGQQPVEDAPEAVVQAPALPSSPPVAAEAVGYPDRPDEIRSAEDTKAAEGR